MRDYRKVKLTNEELGKLLFERLELKYQGQLDALKKKIIDFEDLVFSWERQTQKDIDCIKSKLQEQNPSQTDKSEEQVLKGQPLSKSDSPPNKAMQEQVGK